MQYVHLVLICFVLATSPLYVWSEVVKNDFPISDQIDLDISNITKTNYLMLNGRTGGGGSTAPSEPVLDYPEVNRSGEKTFFYTDLDMGERLNLDTGELSFYVTDIKLEGNSSLPVQFGRRLSSRYFISEPGLVSHFGLGTLSWIPDIPMISGVVSSDYYDGTTTQAGSNWPGVPYLGGNYFSWKGLYLLIPGHDPKKLLWSIAGTKEYQKGYQFVTEDYWIVKRTMTTSYVRFEAVSPSGETYFFDHNLRKPTTKGFGIVAATSASDLFGNTVTYEYNGPILNNSTYSFGRSLSKIVSNDGREINIKYTSNVNSASTYISEVSSNNRKWRYTVSSGDLSKVTLPDNTFWQYTNLKFTMDNRRGSACTYDPNFIVNASAKHPTGLKADYELKFVFNGRINTTTQTSLKPNACISPGRWQSGTEYLNFGHESLAVRKKTLTVPRGVTQIWRYDYQQDFGATGAMHGLSNTKWRQITRPDGSKQKLFFDRVIGWREGELLKEEIRSQNSSLVEYKNFTYSQSSRLYEPVAGTTSTKEDAAKARTSALKTKADHWLNSETYTSEYFYNSNPLNSNYTFGQPREIRLRSTLQSETRINQITYKHLHNYWILNLPEKSVNNGKEFLKLGFTSKGLVAWQNQFGVRTHNYSYNSNGTVSKITRVTDSGQAPQYFELKNYKLGIPQTVEFADNTFVDRTVDNNGWVTSYTNENGHTRNYTYDSMGRMTKIDRPGNWVDTTITFSDLGNGIVKIETTGSERTTSTYDGMMRPVLVSQIPLSGGGTANHVRTEYDGLGRVTFQSLPSSSMSSNIGTASEYDAIGRVLKTRNTFAPYATTTTQFLTDNRTKVIDPEGNVTITRRSGYGSAVDGNVTLIESPHGIRTEMTYDVYGNVQSLRQYGSSNGFNVDQTQHYYYNNSLRLCRHRSAETSDTAFSYYTTGEIRATADGLSAINGCGSPGGLTRVDFSYDERNREIIRNYAHSGTPDITKSYDATGNLTKVTKGATEWTYSYDDLENLRSETLKVDNRTWTTQYHYSNNLFLNGITYPSLRKVDYQVNGLGQIKGASSGSQTYVSNINYHPNGMWSEIRYGNGHIAYQSLHDTQVPNRIWSNHGSKPRVFDLTHQYDKNLNTTKIQDGVNSSNTITMTYDGMQRLITANGAFGNATYTYDSLGNIRQKRLGGRTVNVSYNSLNRVSHVSSSGTGVPTATSAPFSSSYIHDSRGNVKDSGRVSFVYDAANQPVSLTFTGGTASYAYDGNLKRAKQITTNNGSSKTIYSVYGQSGSLIHRHNISDNKKTDYVTLGLSNSGSIRIENNQIKYIHLDVLGSPIAETDSSGNVVWREIYTPYGEVLNNPSNNKNNQGFTGHISDSDTGLVYMQARFYDPVVGRFYSKDPVSSKGHLNLGGEQGFNRYAYAYNNPYKYIDPDGEIPLFAAVFYIGKGVYYGTKFAHKVYKANKVRKKGKKLDNRTEKQKRIAKAKIKEANATIDHIEGLLMYYDRPNGTAGQKIPGGVLGAVSNEAKTGNKTEGKWHYKKAKGFLNSLTKLEKTIKNAHSLTFKEKAQLLGKLGKVKDKIEDAIREAQKSKYYEDLSQIRGKKNDN